MGVEEPADDEDGDAAVPLSMTPCCALMLAVLEQNKMSKKKRKLLSRLSIAQLKQLVKKPDAVEVSSFTHGPPSTHLCAVGMGCDCPGP